MPTSPANGNDWYKIKSTNSNVSPTSTNVRNEVTTELVDLIMKCLRKIGEDEAFLPLFKGVFTALSEVDENRFTRKLDGRGRDILFTGLIVRMIRYLAEYVSIMIICDDVQWADSASIRVLETIHDACPRALMMLATRPIKDYNVTFIKELASFGSCAQITLNGLNGEEIGDIIINTFQSGIKRVSPEIIRVIQVCTLRNLISYRSWYHLQAN
jgi:predicted ATPase